MELIQTTSLPIGQLELNNGQMLNEGLPKNPRFIKDERYEALKKSIEDSPEMLALRELLVYPLDNGNHIIIAGNMRFRACKELGFKEMPCKIVPRSTPVSKLREYTIKDNVPFGQNDWDSLANEWNVDELQEWGMECSFLNVGDVDFDSVDEIEGDNYEAPKIKMLECPHCHHVDMAIHFISFEGNTDGSTNQEPDDLTLGDDAE